MKYGQRRFSVTIKPQEADADQFADNWERTFSKKEPPVCGLCGEAAGGYGYADGQRLCHTDTKNCYFRWTVRGERSQ